MKYDRRAERIVELRPFPDFGQAEAARLDAELAAMAAGRDWEIVTLEADSEEALRETHGSYWPARYKVPA